MELNNSGGHKLDKGKQEKAGCLGLHKGEEGKAGRPGLVKEQGKASSLRFKKGE